MRPLIICAVFITATAMHAQPITVLDVEPSGTDAMVLKLIILPTGPAPEPVTEAQIRFLVDGQPVEQPPPGLRTTTTSVPPARTGHDVGIVSFGPFTLPAEAGEIQARVNEGPWQALGALTPGEDAPRLDRACASAPGEKPVLTVAACEMSGNRRLIVRVGFFNCGAPFNSDLWAFLHFEPEATGEQLSVLGTLGLRPAGKATDSATWAPDEVTVLTFGPYSVPRDAPLPIYLCAGMYDYHGDGARARLIGADASTRVLLGRIVESNGALVFERSAPPKEGE